MGRTMPHGIGRNVLDLSYIASEATSFRDVNVKARLRFL